MQGCGATSTDSVGDGRDPLAVRPVNQGVRRKWKKLVGTVEKVPGVIDSPMSHRESPDLFREPEV